MTPGTCCTDGAARVTRSIVVAAFRAAVAAYGVPVSTLTDNGLACTTRFSGGRGRNGLEHELRRLGVRQKNGKPNHPQTQGKVEPFQQTLKKWLAAQHPQPASLGQRQDHANLQPDLQHPAPAPFPAPADRAPTAHLHRPAQKLSGPPRPQPTRPRPRRPG